MFYSSSADSVILTTEWLCNRILFLLENHREDDAAALATEWEESGGIWQYPTK